MVAGVRLLNTGLTSSAICGLITTQQILCIFIRLYREKAND